MAPTGMISLRSWKLVLRSRVVICVDPHRDGDGGSWLKNPDRLENKSLLTVNSPPTAIAAAEWGFGTSLLAASGLRAHYNTSRSRSCTRHIGFAMRF